MKKNNNRTNANRTFTDNPPPENRHKYNPENNRKLLMYFKIVQYIINKTKIKKDKLIKKKIMKKISSELNTYSCAI